MALALSVDCETLDWLVVLKTSWQNIHQDRIYIKAELLKIYIKAEVTQKQNILQHTILTKGARIYTTNIK